MNDKERWPRGQLCQVDSFLRWRPASQCMTHFEFRAMPGNLSGPIIGLSSWRVRPSHNSLTDVFPGAWARAGFGVVLLVLFH